MGRITITNVDTPLLQDFKSKCAKEGVKMYQKARELLECYTYGKCAAKGCKELEYFVKTSKTGTDNT